MAKIGKIITTGATLLSVAGGAVSATLAVSNVNKTTYENTSEIVEFVDIKEISETDKYIWTDKDGNSYEINFGQYEKLLEKLKEGYNYLEEPEEALVIYCGAVDDIPESLEGLNQINLASDTTVFEVNVKSGYGTGRYSFGQYPTFAIPKNFSIENLVVFNESVKFALTSETYSYIEVGDYKVYYLNTPSYDFDVGGINYQITIVEN